MAKIKLIFQSEIGNNESSIIAEDNKIYINIFDKTIGEDMELCFSKSTAIKFAKTLRTEINKIQYHEQ